MIITPIKLHHLDQEFLLYHSGPPLEAGPLPTIFYFALSGPDSLGKDPFNQPVQFLANRSIRFFYRDLPAHKDNLSPHKALDIWAQDMAKGIDVLGTFFEHALFAVDYGIRHQLIDSNRLGIAGLSRGGFIASHLAAREPLFKTILQFAPLTSFTTSKDLQIVANHPLVQSLQLTHLTEQLANRNIRFYIGNKDTRVDTQSCFSFAMNLSHASTLRSPQIELIMSPSIGQMGHGTAPETFRSGAEWLANLITR